MDQQKIQQALSQTLAPDPVRSGLFSPYVHTIESAQWYYWLTGSLLLLLLLLDHHHRHAVCVESNQECRSGVEIISEPAWIWRSTIATDICGWYCAGDSSARGGSV